MDPRSISNVAQASGEPSRRATCFGNNGKAEEKPLLASICPGRRLRLLLQNSISSSTVDIASYHNLGSILQILDLKLKPPNRVFSSNSTLFTNRLDETQRGGDSRSKERAFFRGTAPCKRGLRWPTATVVAKVKTQPDHLAQHAPLRRGPSPRTRAEHRRNDGWNLPSAEAKHKVEQPTGDKRLETRSLGSRRATRHELFRLTVG